MMKNSTISRAGRLACVFLLSFAAFTANAEKVRVQLDTSSLAGSAYLDLQFNPGAGATPAASAALSGFSGTLAGAAEVIGDVRGALPGTVTFINSSPYNDLFQPVRLGGLFSFLLDFTGDFRAAGFDSGSVFAVSMYGADQMTILGNADPLTGALVSINLTPASLAGQGSIAFNVNDPTLASVSLTPTQVPEPASLLLMLVGGAAFMVATGRRHVHVS